MLVRRAWYERYKWAVLAVGAIGTVGAIIATSTGEELEHRIGEVEGREAIRGIHEHAEAGDLARTLAIVFFVALAAYVLVPWFLDRRGGSAPDGLDAGAAAAAPTTQPVVAAAGADGVRRARRRRLDGQHHRRRPLGREQGLGRPGRDVHGRLKATRCGSGIMDPVTDPEPTGQSVLVVDDEHSIVDAVSTALRYEGFDVTTAMNGRAALAAVQEGAVRPRSSST